MIDTVLSAVIFCLIFFNWPAISSWIKSLWHAITFHDSCPHHPPGEQRNNLDLFGDVDTSQTRDLFDEDDHGTHTK